MLVRAPAADSDLAMPERSKIVIDARYLARASGIGAYVRALVTRLPAIAPDLPLRLWVRHPSHVPLQVRGAVQVHTVGAPALGLRTLLAPASLDRLTARDVFHSVHNILGYGLPCRSVVTVHDTMWLDDVAGCQPAVWRRPISRVYFREGIGHALRRAYRILTVSQNSARCIIQADPSTLPRIVVTPNACEDWFRPPGNRDATRSHVRTILGLEGPYLLAVGQNQPSKAHDLALRAFAAARLPETSLVLVQRLRTGRRLAALAAELGIGHRVRFVGELNQTELIAVMQGATALLQTSVAEGFGLPVLEAAACGCPVIARDLPVMREVMGDAALFVASAEVGPWAHAMQCLVGDAGLCTKAANTGRERALLFSWDKTAERTVQVYREALG